MAHQSTVWGSLEAGAPQSVSFRKRWIWAIPIVIAALLGAAAFWHSFPAWTGRTATTASLGPELSLELERAGTDFRVTWDANSPAVLAARRGTLFIKDGNFEKELALDREQLASAGVVYSPATTDVSFRLEVFGVGPDPVVATVRLLAGSRPEVAAEAPAAETAPPVMTAPPPPEQPAETAVQPPSDAPATMAAAPKPDDIPVPSR
jgi:hypothetical protein